MKQSLLLGVFLFTFQLLIGQSKLLNEISADQTRTYRVHALYPSTLRMINLEHNEDFNKSIKDIKKIKVIRTRREDFGPADLEELHTKLKSVEQYEEYMSWTDPAQQLFLLGRKGRPDQMVLLASNPLDRTLIEILGKVDLLKLINLIQNLRSGEAPTGDAYFNVFQFLGFDAAYRGAEGRN